MQDLEFNIARLQQCLDVNVGTPSVGDVVQVTSTSPLTFDIAPGGGGTGVVESVAAIYPVYVDADPVNPTISIETASKSDSGIVNTDAQEFSGVKTFFDIPQSINGPVVDEDIANKKYVDTFAAGLQVKAAVRAATLVAGTLATSFENGDIIDGVTLATGDRILIKNQVNPIENGIFTVNASGQPSRATDYDAAGEANVGTFTTVTEGSQKNTQWVQVNLGTPTPGTDALNFSRLNISAAVTSIQSPNTTHGTGGTLTGAVKLDATDIYYNGYNTLPTNRLSYQIVTATATTSPATQIISAPKQFTGVQKSTYTPGQGSSATLPTVIANLSYVDTGLGTKLGTAAAALTYAPLASPAFTGTPTAPTPTAGDSSQNIATTAFVQNALNGVSGGGSGGGTLSKKVIISSAQLLTLHSSPVLVIDSPGAGNYIDIISVAYKYNYIAPAYNMNGGVLALVTNGLGGRQITWPNSTVLAQANDVFQHVNAYESSNNNALDVNQPVYFEAKTADPTGGNGTIELDIYYRIVSASGSTSSNMLFKHVPLTASQIKNAYSNPITVLTSPGAGKVIDIISCVFKLNYIAPVYSTTQAYILYNPAVNYPLISIPQGIINSTASIVSKRMPESAELAAGSIVFTNTLADLVSGNSTADLYITYQIITL